MTMTAILSRAALTACALAACGGKPAPPKPKPAPEPRLVAERLHLAMTEMAAIVSRERADCPRMAAALRELFGRMQVTVDEATKLAEDRALARQLTTELRAYDETSRALAEAIFRDLVACKDDRGVQDAMRTMPVLPVPDDAAAPAPTP